MSSNPNAIRWMLTLLGVVLIVVGATVLQHAESHVLPGIELHLGKIVSNVGVVLIFIQLINTFFYRPLSEAIQDRTKELESTFSEAEELRSNMETMRSDYETRITATEVAARDQIQEQLQKAQQLRQQVMEEAGLKADELLKKAEEQITLEKERAMNELRYKVVDLTMHATENLIGKNIDNDTNRELVKQFINQFEVPEA